MNKQFQILLDRGLFKILNSLEKYFRVELHGLENLPQSQCIIFANHSGFNGFDALMLSYGINKHTQRLFRMVTHPFWFQTQFSTEIAERYGLIFASFESMEKQIQDGHSLIIFPEGESGNFKPSTKMYHLQKFRSGLARLSLKYEIPVIPCTIIGAEESTLTISNLKIPKFFPHGLKIPIPLNIIPLPTKWDIKLHPTILTSKYKSEYWQNKDITERISKLWRKRLQLLLYRELKQRPGIFVDRHDLLDKILN